MAFVQTDADLRSLVAGARDIIYACDAAGHFTFANPFAVELLGYPEHEILGRHFLTLIRDDHRDAATKFYGRQFVAKVLDTYFEFPAVRKSGDVLWLGQHVQLIIEHGQIAGFQAIARDITKQKDAEAQLRESEAAYRSLVQNSPLGIFRSSLDRRFIDVNPAFARMLGYETPADVLAIPDIAALYVDPAQRGPLFDELLRTGELKGWEVQWKRRDGVPVTLRGSSRLFRDADGRALATEVIVEDATERLRAEEQRRREQTLEAVGQLATGVAHHFNNLLTGMLGFTELLSAQAGVSAEMKEDLGQILKSGKRATELTRQLKAFSEPRTFRAEAIDVNQILRRIREMLARMMHERTTFVCNPASEPVIIHVDPSELEQAIVHVVRNARDAIQPEGGTVTLDVAYVSNPAPDIRGNYVGVRVVDTGIGMDWETQARMFEPFFTTKPQDEGTGLGLSVTYGIVRQSGGAIDVQSSLHGGTTVTLYFPAT